MQAKFLLPLSCFASVLCSEVPTYAAVPNPPKASDVSALARSASDFRNGFKILEVAKISNNNSADNPMLHVGVSHGGAAAKPASGANGPATNEEIAAPNDPMVDASTALRKSVLQFSSQATTLSEQSRAVAVASLNEMARVSMELPEGSTSIEKNRMYSDLVKDPYTAKSADPIKNIFKQDLNGDPVFADSPNLRKLASDEVFQERGAKVLGANGIKDFDLDILSSALISFKDSTNGDLLGVNKALGGKLDALISNLKLAPNPENPEVKPSGEKTETILASSDEWIAAATHLASPHFTKKLKDRVLAKQLHDAYADLQDIVNLVREYKALDLLDLVSLPLKFDPTKASQNAIADILDATSKTLTKLEPHLGEQKTIMTPKQIFFRQLTKNYKELKDASSNKAQFLGTIKNDLLESNFRSIWNSVAEEQYVDLRRSVALLELSVYVEPLKNPGVPQTRLTSLILHAFRYIDHNRRTAQQRLAQKQQ